jgi:hypothetical protein
VKVTINGYTCRSTVAVMGGKFMLPVSADVRANSGVSAGDELDVALELDTEPRLVTVPDDFAEALAAAPIAQAAFDKMSYSHKSRWVLSIEGAKTPETRQRRITKAIEDITAGK